MERVTVQNVADAAGVGRQSVYRRWPTRVDVLRDALILRAAKLIDEPMEQPPAAHEMEFLLDHMFSMLDVDGAAVIDLLLASRADKDALASFESKIMEPWKRTIIRALELTSNGRSSFELDQLAETVQASLIVCLLLKRPLGALASPLTRMLAKAVRA